MNGKSMKPLSWSSTNNNHCCLIPIRVDFAASSDPSLSLRIIDSYLLDPELWPIPLNYLSLEQSIEANVEYMANAILADSEVIGMARTKTHYFTGRLDLWSWSVLEQIQEQIRPQLQSVAKGQYVVSQSLCEVVQKREERCPKMENNKNKKQKISHDREESSEDSKCDDDNNDDESSSSTHNSSDQAPKDSDQGTSNRVKEKETDTKQNDQFKLIQIQLRLMVNGIRIHDDFEWDPSVALSPLEMAYTIGHDLKLPDEAIQAVAIEIAEQIQGRRITAADEASELTQQANEGGPIKTAEQLHHTTAAWQLDQKIHHSNVAHLTAHYRPPENVSSQ